MKHLAIFVLCLLAQSSFAVRYGAAPVVDIEMGWKGETTKSDKKEDDKVSTAKKKKTEKKSNKTKKPTKEAKDKKTAETSPTTSEDGKEKSPEASELKIDETIPPFNTLDDAIKALKERAEKKYREMIRDKTSSIKDVGAKGQALAELCANIYKRKGKFYITNLGEMPAEGGESGFYVEAGDIIIGFHTGNHSEGLSNTDYKGLKTTNDSLLALNATMESKIAYDVAQQKTFRMGLDAVLQEQNSEGKFVSQMERQRANCSVEREPGKTGYDTTEEFLNSPQTRNESLACDPKIKPNAQEEPKVDTSVEANRAATFGGGSVNVGAAKAKQDVFGGKKQ